MFFTLDKDKIISKYYDQQTINKTYYDHNTKRHFINVFERLVNQFFFQDFAYVARLTNTCVLDFKSRYENQGYLIHYAAHKTLTHRGV